MHRYLGNPNAAVVRKVRKAQGQSLREAFQNGFSKLIGRRNFEVNARSLIVVKLHTKPRASADRTEVYVVVGI